MPVDTKTAPRRTLNLRTFEDISKELDRIEAAHAAGRIGHTGNWTPGQIMQHVSKFMVRALDGFEGSAPLPVRLMGWMLRPMFLGNKPMPSGYKLPPDAAVLLPGDDVTFEQGLAAIRAPLERVRKGERMTQRSPLLGKMTHEQWEGLHAKHASMHFGFISGVE